jgi:Cu-Zn family superoxide dismutase
MAPGTAASQPAATSATTASDPAPLVVTIEPRSGSKLLGTAKFTATADGVQVAVDLTNAPPGQHAAHIHQNADCSSPDAMSAGDHFNPEMHQHGLPPASPRHLGDLGNIQVQQNGTGHLDIVIPGANLIPGDRLSFLGRGIIIHEKLDTGAQPAGNAGGRIGCGEIKRSP